MEQELWKKYRLETIVGMLFKTVEVVFDVMTPLIVADMIDVGVATHDAGYVVQRGILLVCMACLGYCSTLVTQYVASKVSQGVGTDMRNALFQKVNSFGAAEIDCFGTPSLVTRITNDVNQIQLAVAMGIRQLIRWPILAIGSLVAAIMIDRTLGLIFLLVTPLVALVFYLVMKHSIPYYSLMQKKLDHISLVTREALSGVRVIRAFRHEKREEERFREAAVSQADTAIKVGKLAALLNPGAYLLMNLGVVCVLWAGGFKVETGVLQQGQIVAFVNYMTQVLIAIAYVANLAIIFNRAAASRKRIDEVIATEPSVKDAEGAQAPGLAGAAPALVLDHISFSYGPGKPALADVTLSLGKGETLGIIGGTGSGKSTLASLIPRLYDATEGRVLVFGQDVCDWPLDDLRHEVASVPQTAHLVTGTIRSNLSWRVPDATDEELWAALRAAQAEDFVRAKEAGLDSVVEADGRNFSGGQKQRLTIARALVGEPQLVVLDDSASALDFATDAHLREALRTLPQHPTCVIISQRVSAVMGADQILVLHHGHVEGLGTHAQLVDSCAIYREICDSQLAGKEACHA